MNLLLDMNISYEWRDILKNAGINCCHWSDVGDPRADDTTIFDWAKIHDFIVLTHDLDFGDILSATNAVAPSVIQVRLQKWLPDTENSQILIGLLGKYHVELKQGALIIIDIHKQRVRLLPLFR
jgi:predicted nuclease of predicted toxin-antitoxin system